MVTELVLNSPSGEKGTVLVLAPHTDDGELGCGGTVAKLTALGHRVVSVAFSAAEDSVPQGFPRDVLRSENRQATARLGIADEDSIVLDFKVRTFPENRQRILDTMIQLNREYQPSLVFLPSTTDTHQDHRTIADEGFRAFKRATMLAYEVPWNNLEFAARCFVSLSEEDLDRKIAALECYHSQAGRSYVNAEYVRALAKVRGTQIQQPMAELFDVPRLILR
ncbi:MAG: PIG-L deacetylase family protein [Lautropia sp.]|nr:PIG-L deacetylase family protein [Lautropia sp.]